MEQTIERLYTQFAAAYTRGEARHTINGRICSADADIQGRALVLPQACLDTPLEELTAEQLAQCVAAGQAAGLKLYRFKRNHDLLPRVKAVLGFLKGISFDSLLDVGSGRGVFLWPFLHSFPWVTVTSVECLPLRTEFLQKTALGGISNLHAVQEDICRASIPSQSVDVVTVLEVLEHIPDTVAALKAVLRIARKYVILSVPSKADHNPEHIHLFTKERLIELFSTFGCNQLHFGSVNGHLLLYARVER